MAMYRNQMRYIDFNIKNPKCIHCYISDRAYASIITEVMSNGSNETGGVLLGYIINRAWYIMESVDPGMDTVNQTAFFQWDSSYVNHQASRLSKIYHQPVTILGFWHRHPGSMDYFSGQDEATIRGNLCELKEGLLSMLVNIDPKLRMTFYYCYDNDIMPIRYDVGNKYFPPQLLKYADAEELSRRAALEGHPLEIHYEQVINLEALAAKRKKKKAAVPEQHQEEVSEDKSGEVRAQKAEEAPEKKPEEKPEAKVDKDSEITHMQEQMNAMNEEISGLKSQILQMSESVGKLAEAFGKISLQEQNPAPVQMQEELSEKAEAEIVRKALQAYLENGGQNPEAFLEQLCHTEKAAVFTDAESAVTEEVPLQTQTTENAYETAGTVLGEKAGEAPKDGEASQSVDPLRLLAFLQPAKAADSLEAPEVPQTEEAPEISERIIVSEYMMSDSEGEQNDETNENTSM